MDSTLTTLLVCIGLALGTYLCGYLPQKINASQKTLSLIAIFGGGTLVGAALLVVLPESAAILINASNEMAMI